MKKRPFSLLETMLSLLFFGLIIGYCFYRISFAATTTQRIEKANQAEQQRMIFENRMNNLFLNLSGTIKTKNTDHLSFSSYIEADRDPDYCGGVNGALFIDEGSLILNIWPRNGEEENGKREILLRDINELSFSFYAYDQGSCMVTPLWEKSHPPNFLIVHINKDHLEFPFVLQTQKQPLQIP